MTRGPTIRLRAHRDEDFPVLAGLRRDREVQHMLLSYPAMEPPSDERIRDWLASRSADPKGAFLIVVGEDDRALGFVQIAEVHQRGGFAKLGIALVADARGQGVGGQALALLLEHARTALGLRKLLLDVRCDLAAAIHLYAKMGFREVGILRAHYDDGQRRHDVILMERLLGIEPAA